MTHGIADSLQLAQELSGSTCTVYVVEVISVMLEEMGSEITNAGQSIVQVLGRLWEESGDHAIVRIALLRCLTSLVNVRVTGPVCLQ